jgi:hypothetical protein
MDIAALATVAAQANVSQQASILMMKKVMDTATDQSQSLLQLMGTGPALSPAHLGNTIDISI